MKLSCLLAAWCARPAGAWTLRGQEFATAAEAAETPASGGGGLLQRRAPVSAAEAAAKTMSAEGLTNWLNETADPKQKPLPSLEYLQRNAEFALRARREVPAATEVPEDLFRNFVVPFRQLDEPVDEWRTSFFQVLAPIAKEQATLRQVVEAVVPEIWSELRASPLVMTSPNTTHVVFKSNCTPSIMAPISETLLQGHASCTGCSILTANSLRAVGVPARVVGTPDWNVAGGGNHNWVEVWTGEGNTGWEFFDVEPGSTVKWNKGWFVPSNTNVAVSGPTHGIFAAVWDAKLADTSYPYTWRQPTTQWPAEDRTAFYKSLQ